MIVSSVLARSRRSPLSHTIAAVLAIASPAAFATTFVSNCQDSGAGSLRAAVANSVNGDTVNATGLDGVCSKITLSTGAIAVGVNNLTIEGPGVDKLVVSAQYVDAMNVAHQFHNRIFTHTGTGTLTLRKLEASYGYLIGTVDNEQGGCVYSKGSVVIDQGAVSNCVAKTDSGAALGGGVYAMNNVSVLNSKISYNLADGGSTGQSSGAGVMAVNNFTATYGYIAHNIAQGSGGQAGQGGGVKVFGPSVQIHNSAVVYNSAGDSGGGIKADNGSGTFSMVNSTVSHNGSGRAGGIYAAQAHTNIYNSTIAFNASANNQFAPGLHITGSPGANAKLESTLIANNTYGAGSVENDLSTSGVTLTGHNNLVRVTSASVPGDTILGKCPLLAPLHKNGGSTPTHRLLSHSPAIDAGNNTFGDSYDQRGNPFARASAAPGSVAVADIGAYEVDGGDAIFDSGFEPCQ